MKPRQVMIIAGEASGDTLAAELVSALREEMMDPERHYTTDSQPLHTGLEPRFFGAGGPRMAAAGVELLFDLTEHSVVGLSEPLKQYFKFKRLFDQLVKMATERQPDVIICVDFSGFNRRFAHAIKEHARSRDGWFHGWKPKLVQFVSPQVWASRESRVHQIARDFDLLLSIFPFEKQWYAWRVPRFPVEFVGHPMIDRFQKLEPRRRPAGKRVFPRIVLLPGSRVSELHRHLPVMIPALRKIQNVFPENETVMVLPNESLREIAYDCADFQIEFQVGGLLGALPEADLAIASTGTVTMECAYFGVPTVTLYKTSWTTYEIARRMVKVKSLTMPNLLAGEEIYPEFIQGAATPENIARAALDLLRDEGRRAQIKAKLAKVIASLGGPGATHRAAQAIARLLGWRINANKQEHELLTNGH